MSNVRLAIIYYSTYGTNFTSASIAAEAARAAGAEVRLRRVAETVPESVVNSQEAWKAAAASQAEVEIASGDDITWANAYLFATPTRFGSASSQLRAFIDSLGGLWAQGTMADKPVSVMTSAQNPHGGQEATCLGLYTSFCHWGSIIVPPGYSDPAIFATGGNPYGYSHTQGQEFDDKVRASISHQARRLVGFAARLAG